MTAIDGYNNETSLPAPTSGGEANLVIDSKKTIDDIENLKTPDKDKKYTARDIDGKVGDISRKEAKELVKTFDQDGDKNLDQREIEAMQGVIAKAVEEGEFDDGKLTMEEITIYLMEQILELRKNQSAANLSELINRIDINQMLEHRTIEIKTIKELQKTQQEKTQKEDKYDLKSLMELAPEIPKTVIEKLIQLFDKDSDCALNRVEIVQMKNAIEHTLRKDNKTESTEITVEETQSYLLPTSTDNAQELLDKGSTFHFTYQNEAYTIAKNNNTGKYEVFDSNGKKVDLDIQVNEGNIEIDGLTEAGDKIKIITPASEKDAANQTEAYNDNLPPEIHLMV